MGASQSRQEGQRTTFAIFPSSSSIPSLFVGNKHTDVEKVKHTFISRSRKVQNGGLISGQLSFKQRLRDTASFYLVTLLSSTPGFRGHHALLHQARKEGKHKREGCKWKVVMCQARNLPLARIQSRGHAFLQGRLGHSLGVCWGRRGNRKKVWGTASWSLPCFRNMGSKSFIICLHPVSSFTRDIVRLNFCFLNIHICVCAACVYTCTCVYVCSHLFVPRLLQFSLFRTAFPLFFPLFSDQLTWM